MSKRRSTALAFVVIAAVIAVAVFAMPSMPTPVDRAADALRTSGNAGKFVRAISREVE